jgi:hypothetical protein
LQGGPGRPVTKQQGAEYKDETAVSVSIEDDNGKMLAMVDGNAFDSRTLPEGATDLD